MSPYGTLLGTLKIHSACAGKRNTINRVTINFNDCQNRKSFQAIGFFGNNKHSRSSVRKSNSLNYGIVRRHLNAQ
jgi:hypothetical protein